MKRLIGVIWELNGVIVPIFLPFFFSLERKVSLSLKSLKIKRNMTSVTNLGLVENRSSLLRLSWVKLHGLGGLIEVKGNTRTFVYPGTFLSERNYTPH